jgi:arylformamidase
MIARRRFLHLTTGAAAVATMPGGGVAFAQPAPTARAKGPLVWLGMDQKELDDAYTQSAYAPNLQTIVKRCTRNGELVRERLGAPKRFAYGPTAIEGLDVFPAKTPKAPVHVHIHGGAWRVQLASDYHYAAEMFVNAGANFVVPDFNNVIETGGDLFVMADQVRRSVTWAYKNAASFGGDTDRFYISGHSSGGHWVGVLLTTDWQNDFGLPPTFIKGAVAGKRHV